MTKAIPEERCVGVWVCVCVGVWVRVCWLELHVPVSVEVDSICGLIYGVAVGHFLGSCACLVGGLGWQSVCKGVFLNVV
jgi:hypothetical protein